VVCYKANNEGYPSLVLEQVESYSQTMPCDVCCSEPLFCHLVVAFFVEKLFLQIMVVVVMSSAMRVLDKE